MRVATAVLCLALGAAPAAATEVRSLAVAGRIDAVVHVDGIGGGFPTVADAGPLAVRRADGSAARITLANGGLALAPLPGLLATLAAARDDMLPDGEVTRGRRDITAAWLVGPTGRYRHGILGDRIEAAGLRVETSDGRIATLTLHGDSVFEDRRARLVDLDQDGRDEVIVVRSYLDRGAALAVIALADGMLRPVAESTPIGRPSRWLNPVGVADFDGDGELEVAHVETPHIGGILRVHALRDGAMVLEYSAPGFSNHAIGAREQDMAAIGDWNGDGVADIAVPDAQRRALRLVTLAGGEFRELARVEHDAAIRTAVRAADLDGDGAPEIVYGLADSTLIAVTP